MRIILIEDNHRLNQSLKMSLIEEGYAVDTASGAAPACCHARAGGSARR